MNGADAAFSPLTIVSFTNKASLAVADLEIKQDSLGDLVQLGRKYQEMLHQATVWFPFTLNFTQADQTAQTMSRGCNKCSLGWYCGIDH